MSVFAQHSLGHNKDWLRVRYGMNFNVAPEDSESSPPLVELFANIVGGPVERAGVQIGFSKKILFKWVTSQAEQGAEKVEEALNKLILEAISNLLDQNVVLLAQQKKALTLLKKSLGSGVQPFLEAA